MREESKLTGPVRDKAPCGGCAEKFLGCHSNCPKDKRGEYGYKAFQERIVQVKAARRSYDMKYHPFFHDYKEESKDG